MQWHTDVRASRAPQGAALVQVRRFSEAVSAYQAAAAAAPDQPDTVCQLLLAKARVADWRGASVLEREARRYLEAGHCQQCWSQLYGLAQPFMRATLQLQLAKQVAARKAGLVEFSRGASSRGAWPSLAHASPPPRALRVGFLSADYQMHVMAFLTLGLIEQLATGCCASATAASRAKGERVRGAVDVYALSLTPDDRTGWQQRFRKAVHPCCAGCAGCDRLERHRDGTSARGADAGILTADDGIAMDDRRSSRTLQTRFIDLSGGDARSTARKIAALRLHIVVDLNGYTTDERSELLAFRPAPVVMHAVGYPGTMGAAFVPHMLLDSAASPPALRAAITEHLVLLPHCYQVNDHSRSHPPQGASAEAMLPPHVATGGGSGGGGARDAGRPLLVNFNQLYKMSPTSFALWCASLARLPRAQLWLLQQPADGQPHLRAELAACGIDHARRLVLATLVHDMEAHVRRTARAQLLVDTLEYNAHVTGSDSLWSGVPVLTLPGEAMASRVGSSLLRAGAVLPGLVRTLREYTDLASVLVGG